MTGAGVGVVCSGVWRNVGIGEGVIVGFDGVTGVEIGGGIGVCRVVDSCTVGREVAA